MDSIEEEVLTGNYSEEVNERDETPYNRIFLELFTVAALLSIAANCALIFVIIKYKKLRRETTNFIFLHVNVLQGVYLTSLAVTFRGLSLFRVHFYLLCVIHQVEICAGFAITGLLFILIWDSYLKIYYKDKYTKFCRVYKFFIIFNYVLTVCAWSLSVPLCFHGFMFYWTYPIMFLVILIFIVFLIIINIIHAIRKRKLINYKSSNIGLVTTNIFFLLWIPAVIVTVMGFCYGVHPFIIIVTYTLGFVSPIINVIYVYLCDNNFNVFLKQVFTCRCKEYKNEELEDQSVSYNDVNGVQFP